MVYDRLGVPISRGSVVVWVYAYRVFVVTSVYQSLSSPEYICVEGCCIEGRSGVRRSLIIRARSGNRSLILEVLHDLR